MNTDPIELTVNGQAPAGEGVSRRRAMQWVMAAVAASSMPTGMLRGQQGPDVAQEEGRNIIPQEKAAKVPDPNTDKGYGTDPKLVRRYKPGEVWPLTFTPQQKATAAALADVIIPEDQYGPAASKVGVVEMIDEWVSAPYPDQMNDRPRVLDGLAWVDAEAKRRFSQPFAKLKDDQKRAICDDVCYEPNAAPQSKKAAQSFARFRSLCAAAYYATQEGWKAIGYVGNTPLVSFDGPPQEVLARLGVTQTVK